jgi:hypothetical protein
MFPPRGSTGDAFIQQPHGRVNFGKDPWVYLRDGVGWKSCQVVEKGGDATGTGEEEEDDFLATAVVIAVGAGGNDDPVVFSSSPSGPRYYMLAGEGPIRLRRRSAICALPMPDATLQLVSETPASFGFGHSRSRFP